MTATDQARRTQLVGAAIDEIARRGALDVTVAQIARRAGVSSALAHHYFGTKERIFLAAMRHILDLHGRAVRRALEGAETPRARVEAVVRGSFAPANFRPETVAAWLAFYVGAQTSEGAARLLAVYRGRLRSNLLAGLRPLLGPRAGDGAESVAALIDGLYIRQGLSGATPDPDRAASLVLDHLDALLERARCDRTS
jgi:TetR/AcrR family transcriptional repressor of bet genes